MGISSLVDLFSEITNVCEMPIIWNGNQDCKSLLVFAHGAGAPMDAAFMNFFAEELEKKNIRVLRFEFPYMAQRREGGNKRPPNTQKVLLSSWRNIIEECRKMHNGPIYIGGKSMGGRMASMIADECEVEGLICLGYPFFAPGKQDKPRVDHLKTLKTKTLILQGERDVMGSKNIVTDYDLSDQIDIKWLPDGDHGLKPRKQSGHTELENFVLALSFINEFIV
jgi:uncharacterized protein